MTSFATGRHHPALTFVLSSWVLIPGTSLLSDGVLALAYFFALVYLFLGISIISDIFMGSIEVITSQTKEIEYVDENGTK